jgi:hypothetical protein
MSPEQYEELKRLLKTIIHEEVEAAYKNRHKLILEKVDSIQHSVDIGFSNIDEDRKDFAEVKTSQATVERLMKEVLDIVSHQTQRITKTVEDGQKEAIESSAQAVADKVEPVMEQVIKKVKNGIPLKKHPWWKFWKR